MSYPCLSVFCELAEAHHDARLSLIDVNTPNRLEKLESTRETKQNALLSSTLALFCVGCKA